MKRILFNRHVKAALSTRYCISVSARSAMANRTAPADSIRTKWKNITKSHEDKRQYRGLEFSNKLKVLLVSDPLTETSAAALDVNVGSMSDPEELPGLAHFLEHMLFLGTEKFPEENEYHKFLSEHGGSSNAYTAADHTQYFFDVMPEHLEGALDRFSQFFIGPLFTESMTSREVKAVNSEHEKNLASDSWRFNQLEKSMSKMGHPYRKFNTGNIQTLQELPKARGIDVRGKLLDFHKLWYSANTMALVVLGKENIDDLEAMVTPLFRNVANKDVTPPLWLEHPVGPDQMRTQAWVVPVRDIRSLSVLFPIPDYHDHYKSAPCHYLSHLVGHEGPGSLLSALKEKGWCNSLYAGERTPAKGFANFSVTVDLTMDALDHINDIVTLVFQYLNRIRSEGPKEWIFDEIRQLNHIGFRFKDKETPVKYVSNLALALHQYPLEEVLVGPYLYSDWRPDLVQQILDLLIPSRVNVCVSSKSFEPIATLEEPWYGTKYALDTIDSTLIEKWEKCGLVDELKLPGPNVFIPNNLELLPLDDAKAKHPIVIYNSEIARIWFKQDDTFLLPKAIAQFEIFSPLSYLDPLNTSLAYMYTSLLKDDLNEYSYDASLAGLGWNISSTKYGLVLKVEGYNDKLNILLEKILDKMTNFDVNDGRFEIIREIYLRNLRNFESKQPHEQSAYYFDCLLSETAWTKSELLDCAHKVTPKALKEFLPGLLSRLHIEGLIHGNVNKAGAMALVQSIEDRLNARGPLLPLKPRQLIRGRELMLEDGSHYVYEARNSIHKSSCTSTYLQCGLQNTQSNMELELLAQITSEPCFTVLRTKEQLGYLVWSHPRRGSGVQGLQFTIQSDRHPEYLTDRIEAFLLHLRKMIEDMAADEFERHKEALAALRLEKPKKLKEQNIVYWREILSKQYHFDRTEVEVAYLRTITKEQIIEFFDTFIGSAASRRHRLTVYVVSDADGGAGKEGNVLSDSDNSKQKAKKIEDVISFKSGHALYPVAQPYMDIPGYTKSKL